MNIIISAAHTRDPDYSAPFPYGSEIILRYSAPIPPACAQINLFEWIHDDLSQLLTREQCDRLIAAALARKLGL